MKPTSYDNLTTMEIISIKNFNIIRESLIRKIQGTEPITLQPRYDIYPTYMLPDMHKTYQGILTDNKEKEYE